MSRQGEMVRSTSWKFKNKQIPPEDGRNGQIDFTEGSRTNTYLLKMEKWSCQLHERVKNKHIPSEDGEMVRSNSWKGQEQAHTS